MTGAVVVPLDGSDRAERAIPIAISLAVRASSPLRLIHVHSTTGATFATMDAAERYLRAQVDRLRDTATIVIGDVMRGDVLDGLTHETTPRNAAWVVMTSGGAGDERQGLGRVSAALTRKIEVPVVLCGPAMSVQGGRGPAVEMRNIAIALDSSTDIETAIAHTVRFARLHGARVTLISVAPAGAGQKVAARLDALADRLDEPDLHVSRRLVRSRDTARGLVRAALEEDADALAIGRGFLERDPAATAVVTAAKQPLLI